MFNRAGTDKERRSRGGRKIRRRAAERRRERERKKKGGKEDRKRGLAEENRIPRSSRTVKNPSRRRFKKAIRGSRLN